MAIVENKARPVTTQGTHWRGVAETEAQQEETNCADKI